MHSCLLMRRNVVPRSNYFTQCQVWIAPVDQLQRGKSNPKRNGDTRADWRTIQAERKQTQERGKENNIYGRLCPGLKEMGRAGGRWWYTVRGAENTQSNPIDTRSTIQGKGITKTQGRMFNRLVRAEGVSSERGILYITKKRSEAVAPLASRDVGARNDIVKALFTSQRARSHLRRTKIGTFGQCQANVYNVMLWVQVSTSGRRLHWPQTHHMEYQSLFS